MKSRLATDLGTDAALELYRSMLTDLLRRIEPIRDEVSVEILWTGEDPITSNDLTAAFGDHELCRQSGAHLGERLQMAFSERVFFHEAARVIAIGVDDPGLDAAIIRNAFALLGSCEWVVGPAEDGGYWMIGCRAGSFRSAVFRDMKWGTDTVLAETLGRLRTIGCSFAILPVRRDIDDRTDLEQLYHAGELPPATAATASRIVQHHSSEDQWPC